MPTALQEAIERYGKPEIFNTDQGAQFTSTAFTQVLKDHDIAISMDGRGRCQDNIFVERLWWTLKHHYIYLHAFLNFEKQKSVSYSDHRNCREIVSLLKSQGSPQ